MSLLTFNFAWMSFNVFLATIPVVVGWLLFLTKNKAFQVVYGLIWLLFLPNSIYLFTDIVNFIAQWRRVEGGLRGALVLQYGFLIFLGLITFILSLYPFEKFLKGSSFLKNKGTVQIIIILLNFVIGFGITLGRVKRVNSWDVVIAPQEVLISSFSILASFDLLLLTLFFGLFANLAYFLFKKPIINFFKTYLTRVGVLH